MSVRSHLEIEELLAKKPKLRKLDVANGGLSSLPDALNDASLHKLAIFANAFATIPSQVRRQTSLREFALTSNLVVDVPEWFGELSKLQVLDLERNAIGNVSLDGPASLRHLNLNWNPVGSLRLRNMPALNRLDLAKHTLERLETVVHLPALTELNCTNGPLAQFPDLSGCADVARLNLRSNMLTELPESVATAPNLELLHMSGNPIVDWPRELASSVESLFIEQTGIHELPECVLSASCLGVLRASSNRGLREVPEGLAELPVRYLDLAICSLTEFPRCIAEMSGLQRLLLNHNPIEAWPDFDPPPGLIALQIRNCPVADVPPPPAWQRFAP